MTTATAWLKTPNEFPIPMRGNEMNAPHGLIMKLGVSNPHEG